jgi:hypothetical protein
MGGQPWPELELHGRPWGARRRGKRGGKEEGSRGRRCGAPWGGKGAGLASYGLTVAIAHSLLVVKAVVRAVHEREEKEEREKKRKGRKTKEKKRKGKKRKEKKKYEKKNQT